MYRSLTGFKRNAAVFTSTNEAFLKHLKREQTLLFNYQKKTQVIGFLLAAAGLLLYMYETIYNRYNLWIAYLITIAWLAIMWFIVRPMTGRKAADKLTDKIHSIERLAVQINK